MRKPLTLLFLFSATLVGIALNGEAWLAGKQKSATISTIKAERSFAYSTAIQFSTVFSGEFLSAQSAPQVVPPILPMEHPLSADESALVAEMCDLQLLSYNTPLTLDSRQWSAFAGLVLRTQAIRQTYEAQIATSKMVAPGLHRVEIPVYASAGDVLRENFYADLRSELGRSTAAKILAIIGDRLESRFAGFGVSAQTLDIAGNPGGALNDVQVTRTVTYWNSVEGSDKLTTRSEILFPAWEDPTGECWSELLSMVKAS